MLRLINIKRRFVREHPEHRGNVEELSVSDEEISAINDDEANLDEEEEEAPNSTKRRKTGAAHNHALPSIPFWKSVDQWLRELTAKWGTLSNSSGWKR